MTPDDLAAAMTRLGLDRRGLAYLCGVHRLTVNHWFAGRAGVPGYVEPLLEFYERSPKLGRAIIERRRQKAEAA